jgi:hypothetical protein
MLSATAQCLGGSWLSQRSYTRNGIRWFCPRDDGRGVGRIYRYSFKNRQLRWEMSKKNRISTGTSKHHRLPSSRGGGTNTHNCVMITPELHQLWHKWFQNETPVEIQVEICRTFYGFSEDQMKDIRVEAFLDMVSSITEAKDRRV